MMMMMMMVQLKVYVANTGPFLCGCIRYNYAEEINVAMIAAIAVLIGVPLILHLIVAIIYICQRRETVKDRHITDKDKTMSKCCQLSP